MLTIGRIFAGNGWRYLWDQVAGDAGDYYLLDVGRGEAPGRWGGSAAEPELGLVGRVSEERMRNTFGRLAHPVTGVPLGRPPLIFRSVEDRLAAARARHDRDQTARWAQRELALLDAGASRERIDTELAAFRARATEAWAAREATTRRGGQRRAVAGFDLTFSPPKSVSVLWAAAPAEGRQKIWDAHHEGVAAAMRFIEREASLSRTGYTGVRQVDTTGLITASFDHRTSRAGDVHIHTHTATLNRVRCDDGAWRALDGRALYRCAAAARAIYERVREAALERDLGVRHELDPVSGAREIVGVDPAVRRLFSSRRIEIEGRLVELVAKWRAEHGADPSEWMVTRLAEWARLETRAPKGPGEATADALARWDAQTRAELGRSLNSVWDAATHPNTADRAGDTDSRLSADDVLAAALRAVDQAKSTWTRYDLARELTRWIDIDTGQPADVTLARVDRLVATALTPDNCLGVVSLTAPPAFVTPSSLRRDSDGTSVYTEHGADRYTTNVGLAIERHLLAAARNTTGRRVDQTVIDTAIARRGLDGEQATAVTAVLASGRTLDALVGPAGTGKTTAMAAVADAWASGGGQVLGVSTAENATRVLAGQAGIPTVNAAKLIYEHTQRPPERRQERWWQDSYAIAPGALVILDEAGMASRQTIDALTAICTCNNAKLLLVGDPEQLPSPDAGGAFELIATHTGAATLGQVRRFEHAWERAASLRLRAGDPTVLDDYDRRGRITGGTTADQAEDAALAAAMADRARGLDVYLLADTNDTVARLSRRVRDQLVAAGRVDDTHTVTLADGNRVGVGDCIATRHNDRLNRSGDGRFVANRDLWTVRAVTDIGGLHVARVGTDHTVFLDTAYVADRVQLAYACTVHAAQGATVDIAHTVLARRSTRTSVYVGLTRGRHENHAYVICNRPEGGDIEGPADHPVAVLADILDRPDPPDAVAALQVQVDEATRAASLATLFPIWHDLLAHHATRHAEHTLAAIGGPELAEATVRSPAFRALAARLRRLEHAGIDPAAALAGAAAQEPLDDADDLAAVLHWRLRHTETTTTDPAVPFTQLTPADAGDLADTARQVAAAMDDRTTALARQVEINPPVWVDALGPRPDDPDGQQAWLDRAGIVAGYREAFAVTTVDDPIGPAPAGDRVDAHAWWTRAAAALTNSPAGTLAALPAERLEAIIHHAHTHLAQAPPSVAHQLRATALASRAAHTRAGTALAHDDNGTARSAAAEAARLDQQLQQLEHAQTHRDRWNLTAARLDHQAAAAQALLDHRQTAQHNRPYNQYDTSTLARRLRTVRHRADQATTTAKRYDRHADQTANAIVALLADIEHTATVQPARSHARQTVTAEQHAATRMTAIQTALDATRLRRRTIRGHHRTQLTAELQQIRRTYPALATIDLTVRWDALIAAGETADHNTLVELKGRHEQAIVDLDWYANTATQLRADVDHQHETITAIRAELTNRTSTPHPPTPRPGESRSTPHPKPHAVAVAQNQITASPKPPQDTPGL
jgi:conjugative relaxase-like TrwC/TraI family protein